MPFFSVIIPVYNVEQYLEECVNSIINQRFSSYEIILIDDGSTDNSSQICDDLASNNRKIKVIHKDNGGASSARNCGIRVARGKYLIFLDSDDYLKDLEALSKIHDKCYNQNVDVIVFSAGLLYPDGKYVPDMIKYQAEFEYQAGDIEALRQMIRNQEIVGSCCTKAINREFFINNDLYFMEGTRSEDIDWIIRLVSVLPSYHFIHEHFYVYRKGRIGSVTNTMGSAHLEEYYQILFNVCNAEDYNYEIKEIILNYVAYQYMILCAHVANCREFNFKVRMLRKLKKMEWLFNYTMNPKVKQVAKLKKIIGFYCSVFLLKAYLKHRKR